MKYLKQTLQKKVLEKRLTFSCMLSACSHQLRRGNQKSESIRVEGRRVAKESNKDMEFRLNPDAAEFVPLSNSTPISIPPRINSDFSSSSTPKPSQKTLPNWSISSEKESLDTISPDSYSKSEIKKDSTEATSIKSKNLDKCNESDMSCCSIIKMPDLNVSDPMNISMVPGDFSDEDMFTEPEMESYEKEESYENFMTERIKILHELDKIWLDHREDKQKNMNNKNTMEKSQVDIDIESRDFSDLSKGTKNLNLSIIGDDIQTSGTVFDEPRDLKTENVDFTENEEITTASSVNQKPLKVSRIRKFKKFFFFDIKKFIRK